MTVQLLGRPSHVRLGDVRWALSAWRKWWPAAQDHVLADLVFVAKRQPVSDAGADELRYVRLEVLIGLHLVEWNGERPCDLYVDDAPPRGRIPGYVLTQAGVALARLALRRTRRPVLPGVLSTGWDDALEVLRVLADVRVKYG